MDFIEILNKVKLFKRFTSDLEVANWLGLTATAFNARKKRNRFPIKELELKCYNESINLDKLLADEREKDAYEYERSSTGAGLVQEEDEPFKVSDKNKHSSFLRETGMSTLGDTIRNIFEQGDANDLEELRQCKEKFIESAIRLSRQIDAKKTQQKKP